MVITPPVTRMLSASKRMEDMCVNAKRDTKDRTARLVSTVSEKALHCNLFLKMYFTQCLLPATAAVSGHRT